MVRLIQVRKLRRELADAKDKVHTLTTQLTTNVSTHLVFLHRKPFHLATIEPLDAEDGGIQSS